MIALHSNLCIGTLRNLFWHQKNLNLEFIWFMTRMAMDSCERISSKMQPKYVTLEYCFTLRSLYWMFSGFEFLILYLLPSKIDFVISSHKWIPNLLSTNQSQSILKFLFSAISVLVIYLFWNIKQVSSAYSNSSQSTACGYHLCITEKGVVPKRILKEPA